MTIQKRVITAKLLRKYENGIQVDAYDSLQLVNDSCIELVKNGIVVAVVEDYWSQVHLSYAFEMDSVIDCSISEKFGRNLKIEVTLQQKLVNQIEISSNGTVGIYAIECKENNIIYIGQSSNIHKRFAKHLEDLSIGFHHNVDLQDTWITYKNSIFIFKLIQEFLGKYEGNIEDRKWLEVNEKKWIEHFNQLGLCINRTKGEFVDTKKTLLEQEKINLEQQKILEANNKINDDKIKLDKKLIKNKITDLEKIVEIESERLSPLYNRIKEINDWINENTKFFSFMESSLVKKKKQLLAQELSDLNTKINSESETLRHAYREIKLLNQQYRLLRTSKQKKLRVYEQYK
jgi:hypothetical protein